MLLARPRWLLEKPNTFLEDPSMLVMVVMVVMETTRMHRMLVTSTALTHSDPNGSEEHPHV